jgi:hypothetical protein
MKCALRYSDEFKKFTDYRKRRLQTATAVLTEKWMQERIKESNTLDGAVKVRKQRVHTLDQQIDELEVLLKAKLLEAKLEAVVEEVD